MDQMGPGHAQPDAFLVLPKHILLYECKLTQTVNAFLQMAQLYVPLLEQIFERPVMTLQVCRNLRYTPEAERTPQELIANPEYGNFTWHCLEPSRIL